MNRPTSLYLDLVRFVAAMMVFVSHAVTARWSGGLFWRLEPLGQEAVVIFFVLSGFVIGYAAEERDRTVGNYAVNRLARIYSVVIPALLLTFALDRIGSAINPASYATLPNYVPHDQTIHFLASALFINQARFAHIQPGTDAPYWSMGYEIPYYVAFGVAFFGRGPWRFGGAAAVMLALGPNVAVLFPMWLLGFGTYRVCATRPLGARAGTVVLILSAAGIVALLAPLQRHGGLYDDFSLSASRLRDLGHYYAVAILFAASIAGFRGASAIFAAPLDRMAAPIRWAGQRTFALYLFHLPLMQFLVAVSPWPPSSWSVRAIVFIGVPAIVFALAEVTERRKGMWRTFFGRMIGTAPHAAGAWL